MERVILHCDANAFYASVECLYTPSIRHSPVAVCGSVEERHGIVLTKNQIAKQFGVQTGEAVRRTDRGSHLAGAPEVPGPDLRAAGLRALHPLQQAYAQAL